jgi:hypothetical protein
MGPKGMPAGRCSCAQNVERRLESDAVGVNLGLETTGYGSQRNRPVPVLRPELRSGH